MTHHGPVMGGPDRIAAVVPLHNELEVPDGVHHDVDHPIPVTVALHWETGTEYHDTVALEWWGRGPDAVVRVRMYDQRVMTGAVWVPAKDVRRA